MASWWYGKFRTPAPWFNIKMTSYQYKKSHSGDRRSDDRLISTIGFPILVRLHLYIESGPWWQASYGPYHSLELPNHGIRHVMCCTSWQCSVVLSRDPSDWWLKPDQAPVPLTIFRSNSKLDENSERSSFEYTGPITTIFCTRHDSDTVVNILH